MKERIRKIVEDNSSRKGKLFDYFIQVLILFSLVAFAISTFPNNTKETIRLLNVFEITCVAIFTIEYALRVFVSGNKARLVIYQRATTSL